MPSPKTDLAQNSSGESKLTGTPPPDAEQPAVPADHSQVTTAGKSDSAHGKSPVASLGANASEAEEVPLQKEYVARAVKEIAELVPLAEPQLRRQVGSVVARAVRQVSFEGPIPHPQLLKQYGQVVPTAPERILAVFEEDSKHIRDIQRDALRHQSNDNRRQHWMAFIIIAVGYVMSLVFALLDKDVLAGLVLTSTIVGTVVAFLQQRKVQGTAKPSDDEEVSE